MAKLWEGKFEKKLDNLAEKYNSSISIDARLYVEDIVASKAHAKMLGKCNIISENESKILINGLDDLLAKLNKGEVLIDKSYEDIHSFVEFYLTENLGDVAKKLHTARSRNDQVATDFKMYCLKAAKLIKTELINTIESFLFVAKDNIETYMPAYTHLQPAQATTFAHYILAYCQMLKRDILKLDSYEKNNNCCPLGSCALCGTTYNIDRFLTSDELGFENPCENSLDGVSDRDFVVELHSIISMIAMHLSRLSEEIILFCTQQFKFIELDESYSTGSSIMPQKKNPDIAELIRGKTGKIYGNLMAMLTTLKGLPLAYNKDMQEDKESLFYSIDSIIDAIKLINGMVSTAKINKDKMLYACNGGYLNATDCADYLTKKGLAFRDAYKITGKLVKVAIEKEKTLSEIDLDELKNFSPLFENDVYNAIDIKECVLKRNSYGAPAPNQVKIQINNLCDFIADNKEK